MVLIYCKGVGQENKKMKTKILQKLKKELAKHVDKKYKQGALNYFKEPIKLLGVRSANTRKISQKYFGQIKTLDKKEIFELAESLMKTGVSEYQTVGFDWVYRIKKQFSPTDFKTFEKWLKNYITNWGSCDDFCAHALGYFIELHPRFIKNLKQWTRSPDRWLRRGAAVALVAPARKGKFLKEIFQIAGMLVQDEDDLARKGYGWMLKEASHKHEKEVFSFVMKNKHKMPRVALRYAIEKMPADKKKRAMVK